MTSSTGNPHAYGWNAQEPQSCSYLIDPVMEAITRIRPSSVIDIGCGNGALCGHLASRGYTTVGTEPDPSGIDLAREKTLGASFYQLPVEADPQLILDDFPSGFDVAISTEVIEHLYAPEQLLQFASALLTAEGYLILTTPYHGYLKNLALSVTNRWDFHFHVERTGGHIKFFSRRSLTALLERNGFTVASFRGIGRVPPLYKSMLVVARRSTHR